MTATPPPLDPSPCAGEAPPMSGAVQGHGAVLALEGPELVVEQASRNLRAFLGTEAEAALGRPLADLLPEAAMVALLAHLEENDTEAFRLPGTDGLPPLFASLQTTPDGLLLELEHATPPITAGLEDDPKLLAAFAEILAGATTISALTHATTALVSEVARFDRSLIYRFRPDWTGEVVAEVRRPEAPALLGLRFPTATVPPDVRRLAEQTPLRLVADTGAPPVFLLPEINPRTGRSLDLRRTPLRSATPAQLQTWHRLGVAAAINLSLIVEGRLWGLLVCHHQTPHPISPPLRRDLTAIARATAAALARVDSGERFAAGRRSAHRLSLVQQAIRHAGTLVQPLLAADPGLMDLADADGVAVITEDAVACVGFTPESVALRRLATLTANQQEGTLVTDRLSDHDSEATSWRAQASGMLAITITDDPRVVIAAFRRERHHEIIWGDQAEPTTDQTATETPLTPRPFTPRRERVSGRCSPWEPEIVAAWRALPARLSMILGGLGATACRLIEEVTAPPPPERLDQLLPHALLDTATATLVTVRSNPDAALQCLSGNRVFRRLFPTAPDVLSELDLGGILAAIGLDDPRILALPFGAEMDFTPIATPECERTLRIGHRPLLRLSGGDGERAFTAWSFEDVSAGRRVEQALQSARDHAVGAIRALAEFQATMSHALRTPLNTIIGFSEIMRAEMFGALGSPKYREYVRNIQTSGENLLAVIDDGLDLSTANAGLATLEERELDLCALAEDLCREESEHATRAGVRLMLDTAARTLPAHADERAITQILRILLANAFTFTPAGGMVTCRIGPHPTDAPSGAMTISVEDTGCGIPADHLQRAFEPPPQNRDRHTRKTLGGGGAQVGHGLALVRVLAEWHGGRVTVDNRASRGTIIRVTLPPWRTPRPDLDSLR